MTTNLDGNGSAGAPDRLHNLLTVAYVCYALGWVLGGVPVIAGLIMLYLKRDDAAGTIYESHITWLIRTFWLGVLLGAIGVVTFLLLVGYLVLVGAGIWYLYRLIKGGLALLDHKPVADPTTWF
jgi:uncharacterized membrane protein